MKCTDLNRKVMFVSSHSYGGWSGDWSQFTENNFLLGIA